MDSTFSSTFFLRVSAFLVHVYYFSSVSLTHLLGSISPVRPAASVLPLTHIVLMIVRHFSLNSRGLVCVPPGGQRWRLHTSVSDGRSASDAKYDLLQAPLLITWSCVSSPSATSGIYLQPTPSPPPSSSFIPRPSAVAHMPD